MATNTIQEPYEYISIEDAAVDSASKGFAEKWRLYRDGKGEAPLKEGKKPAVYTLRHLSAIARTRLAALAKEDAAEASLLAVGIALLGVRMPDGEEVELRREQRKVGLYPVSVVAEEEFERLAPLAPDVIRLLLELGGRVLEVDFPRPS